MADFSLRPYGIDVRGELIEKADATGFKVDKNGNVISREFCENPWRHVTPESAIAEAQRSDNLCSWDFSSGWGGSGVNATVDFLGHEIPCRDMTTTGNANCYQTTYPIIPSTDVAYIFSIWMYSVVKSAGTNYMGMTAYNQAGSNIGSYRISNGQIDTNQYFSSYSWSDTRLPRNKWTNYRGIIVPYIYSSGITEHYSGNIVMNTPEMMVVEGHTSYRFHEDSYRLRMRFLEYYNNGNQAISYWALPSIIPIKVADLRNDKAIFKHIREGVI
jgi:hypothetical protein